VIEHYAAESPGGASEEQLLTAKARRAAVQLAFDKLEKSIIRERIAVHRSARIGRGEDEIREITIEVGVTPRTHARHCSRGADAGSERGGPRHTEEEMRLDTLGLETKKYYWHHYNFPPFSVGEAGRMGGVKRRDIGHGALAERALAPCAPIESSYRFRVVSDDPRVKRLSSMASCAAPRSR